MTNNTISDSPNILQNSSSIIPHVNPTIVQEDPILPMEVIIEIFKNFGEYGETNDPASNQMLLNSREACQALQQSLHLNTESMLWIRHYPKELIKIFKKACPSLSFPPHRNLIFETPKKVNSPISISKGATPTIYLIVFNRKNKAVGELSINPIHFEFKELFFESRRLFYELDGRKKKLHLNAEGDFLRDFFNSYDEENFLEPLSDLLSNKHPTLHLMVIKNPAAEDKSIIPDTQSPWGSSYSMRSVLHQLYGEHIKDIILEEVSTKKPTNKVIKQKPPIKLLKGTPLREALNQFLGDPDDRRFIWNLRRLGKYLPLIAKNDPEYVLQLTLMPKDLGHDYELIQQRKSSEILKRLPSLTREQVPDVLKFIDKMDYSSKDTLFVVAAKMVDQDPAFALSLIEDVDVDARLFENIADDKNLANDVIKIFNVCSKDPQLRARALTLLDRLYEDIKKPLGKHDKFDFGPAREFFITAYHLLDPEKARELALETISMLKQDEELLNYPPTGISLLSILSDYTTPEEIFSLLKGIFQSKYFWTNFAVPPLQISADSPLAKVLRFLKPEDADYFLDEINKHYINEKYKDYDLATIAHMYSFYSPEKGAAFVKNAMEKKDRVFNPKHYSFSSDLSLKKWVQRNMYTFDYLRSILSTEEMATLLESTVDLAQKYPPLVKNPVLLLLAHFYIPFDKVKAENFFREALAQLDSDEFKQLKLFAAQIYVQLDPEKAMRWMVQGDMLEYLELLPIWDNPEKIRTFQEALKNIESGDDAVKNLVFQLCAPKD